MTKVEQLLVAKISQAPVLWMFCITAVLFILSFIGVGIQTFSTTTSIGLLGIALTIFCIICMVMVLTFYSKHGLANSKEDV